MYARTALIDTAAVIALHRQSDQHHAAAVAFFRNLPKGWAWYSLRVTTHETFTTTRYSDGLQAALVNYDFLRVAPFELLDFDEDDEAEARSLIERLSGTTTKTTAFMTLSVLPL